MPMAPGDLPAAIPGTKQRWWPRFFQRPSQFPTNSRLLAVLDRPLRLARLGGDWIASSLDLASLFVMHPYFARQQNMTWHGVYDKQLKGHGVFLEFTCMTPVNTRFLRSTEPITNSISMVVVPVPSGYHRQSSRTRGDHDIS